ncbi:MAG TPA: hypothetical protein EYH28_05250 [Anaerolineaceae bacterium]|nr:hypothetical protein [Anaerolineaceae bacterium]
MDDTTLDKPYARWMRLVTRHWSGKHQRVVQGLNLISLLWSQGQVKAHRLVSVEGKGHHRPGSTGYIPPHGRKMHLKGYGWVKGFKTVTLDGGEEYWATSQLDMSVVEAAEYARRAWQMEVYPQGLKRFTGIERGQFRMEKAQRDGLAIWAYLAQPTIILPATT